MKKIISVFLMMISLVSVALAQNKALPIYTAATNDKAFIIVVNTPENSEGFFVYRKLFKEKKYTLLTSSPIVPLIDQALVKSVLREDYDWVKNSLRAEDDFDIVRRLQSDAGAAAVLSLASLNVAKAAGRLFVDEKVEEGEQYSYKILFVDYSGEKTAEIERTIIIADKIPLAPLAAKADADDGQIKVSWDYPKYEGDKNDITVGFNIYKMNNEGKPAKINDVLIFRQEEMKYRTDLDVINGKTYSYFVTSVDCIGRESPPSDTATATPIDKTPPKFPKSLNIVSEEGKILVTWKMNLELDVDHYDVYRSSEALEGYEKINALPVPSDQPFYYDDKVFAGPAYYYKIKAIDFSGNESDFSNSMSGKPADSKPPAKPDSVLAIVTGNFVSLKWKAPSDIDLQGFYVYSRRSDQKFLRVVSLPIPADSLEFLDAGFEEKGLWQGRTYYYGVSAIDNFFNESEMEIVKVVIPDNEPPKPPVTSYAEATEDGFVEVTWQPSMSLDVAAYRIYRSDESGEVKKMKDLPEGIYSAVDSTSGIGKTYGYQVVAVDSSGNESEKTGMIRVTPTDATIPPAPTGIEAVDNSGGVYVTWEAVNVNDLAGYNIYKADLPNGIKTKLNDKPVSKTDFFDLSGSEGTYYFVSALDTSLHENISGAAEAKKQKK